MDGFTLAFWVVAIVLTVFSLIKDKKKNKRSSDYSFIFY